MRAAGDQKPAGEHFGLFDAVDTTTGKIAWKMQVPNRTASSPTVAGDLVFLGQSNGTFNAVDAKSGKVLWSYKSSDQGIGGANGQPAVYMANGREYVAMAFGGNSQVRNTEDSPVGDALIVFALPQNGGQNRAKTTSAQPVQLDQGGIPDSNLAAGTSGAPQGAQVIELAVHDFRFYPAAFIVQPGQQVAVHINNTDPFAEYKFAVKLPSGPVGLRDAVRAGKDTYFVFTAPNQPGDYQFFSPNEEGKFKGATGTVIVGNKMPADPASLVPDNVAGAAAILRGESGQDLGFATYFSDAVSGVHFHVNAVGFAPAVSGNHAVVIESGKACSFAAVKSAGSGSNVGLPDIGFQPDGSVDFSTVVENVSMTPGSGGLFGQQGNTLVIYSGPSDNPGQPIACGVIQTKGQ